jgi:Skp family chaperone for outer membrane proteins
MKSSLAIVATLASGFVLSAAAQTAAPAAPAGPAKIAVIAFQMAVAQTNEGQRDLADVEKKFQPKQAQLKAQSDEIDTLTKQLQAQAQKLSPAEQQSRASAIDTKKKQLDRDAQDAQSDFQQAVQDMYNTLASKVYDVMSTYAEQHGFTLVLDISQQNTPVLYTAKANDITKQIVEAYNVKSGVPAPPAAPPAAPTPQSGK